MTVWKKVTYNYQKLLDLDIDYLEDIKILKKFI